MNGKEGRNYTHPQTQLEEWERKSELLHLLGFRAVVLCRPASLCELTEGQNINPPH